MKRRKDGMMRLRETEMGSIDRNFRRIAVCEILAVDHENQTVRIRRVHPNMTEEELTFPISDTAGLTVGMHLDYEEPTPNTAKIWGITPEAVVEQFKADLEKWKKAAAAGQ